MLPWVTDERGGGGLEEREKGDVADTAVWDNFLLHVFFFYFKPLPLFYLHSTLQKKKNNRLTLKMV